MSDYIKREDAINEIKLWATNLRDPRFIVREDAECALMAIPSADVVEVVRCKDCKYRKPLPNVSYGECICVPHMVSNDDYCSYGERKDGKE